MAVRTVLKVTFTTDRDWLPGQVEKLMKFIKGLMPVLQLAFDKVGLRNMSIKVEDKEV